MEELIFTENEIRAELTKLGYSNIPNDRIKDFKRDLESLIKEDRHQNLSTTASDVSYNVSTTSDPRQKTSVGVRTSESNARSSYYYPPRTEVSDHINRDGFSHNGGLPVAGDFHSEYVSTKEPYTSKTTSRQLEPPKQSVGLKSCLKETLYTDGRDSRTHLRGGGGGDRAHLSGDGLINDCCETSSVLNDNASVSSSTSTEHRIIKRKVLRKRNGHVEICNESITENESDDVSCLGENMRHLQLNVLNDRPLSAPTKVSASEPISQRSHVACREHLFYNLPDGYHGPKALIRPMSCEPHMKNIKKSDPVEQYQKYRKSWDVCKAPGERSHNQLRWDVREQMFHQDPVEAKKPQPVRQPNPYVVPSDKKRKTLRWQIRRDLAQGVKPPSVFD